MTCNKRTHTVTHKNNRFIEFFLSHKSKPVHVLNEADACFVFISVEITKVIIRFY